MLRAIAVAAFITGAAIGALVSLPGAQAQSISDETDVRSFVMGVDSVNRDSAPAGVLYENDIRWEPPYSYSSINRTIRVEMTYTATIQLSSNGEWNVTLESNKNGSIPPCFFIVETINPGGFLEGDLVLDYFYNVKCLFEFSDQPEPETFNVWVNRTLESGTPNNPIHESVSVLFTSQDEVIVNPATPFEIQTGVTGIEFVAMLIVVFGSIIVWSRSKDMAIESLAAVATMFIGVVALSLITAWAVWASIGGIITLAGIYMFIRTVYTGITDKRSL